MQYLPHPKLSIVWSAARDEFTLKLPWLTMGVDVDPNELPWIEDATQRLFETPDHPNVQKFLKHFSDYPVSYIKARTLDAMQGKDLAPCPQTLKFDLSTPQGLLQSIGIPAAAALGHNVPTQWSWNWSELRDVARIPGTSLYDPMTFISYLILYRLDWESTTWCGQDGLGKLLERYLAEDESKFFWLLGLISRQSWQVTMDSNKGLEPALDTVPQAREAIEHFMMDEAGHYKFMEMVFEDIGLNREDFPLFPETRWLLDCHKLMASEAPLAFASMINIFEAAFYEGQDPISRVVLQSSKPHAARGYDLHYKINQEHRHCDMPLVIGQHLAPQTREQLELTMAIFELTLVALDSAEARMASLIPEQLAA